MKKILQDFKAWFWRKWYRLDKPVYICDYKKNKKCLKGPGCWYMQHGPCKCTHKKSCAKIGPDGKPIIASDEDVWNDEYLDYKLEHDPDWQSLVEHFKNSQKKQGL